MYRFASKEQSLVVELDQTFLSLLLTNGCSSNLSSPDLSWGHEIVEKSTTSHLTQPVVAQLYIVDVAYGRIAVCSTTSGGRMRIHDAQYDIAYMI